MSTTGYVHGYSAREAQRLADQAGTLAQLLHHDTAYPAGSAVLEAGCGTGCQSLILAEHSPGAAITSVDISQASLDMARAAVRQAGHADVRFLRADIFNLPFAEQSFDHVFVCFVLEHLADPLGALKALRKMLRPGGSICVVEGDHGSCYFHPETPAARQAWQCLVDSQARLGGDSLIGRRVFPLLEAAGFQDIQVSPRMVYVDASRPQLVEGFIRRTIIPMVEGVRQASLEQGIIDQATWEAGIAGLHQSAQPGGSFCYTFFKGLGIR
jgi:SAM-dependent methyltransferase